MKSKQTHDEVHNPKHYDLFPDQQAIDIIQASLTDEEFAGYCKGNALKYRLRAGSKGDALQCIAKANWYQSKLWETPCESADEAWPDETRIDAIGQNGNDGAAYPFYALEGLHMDNNLSTLGYFIQEMNAPTFAIYLEFQGADDSFILIVNDRHTFTGTRYDAACKWLEALYEAQK